MKPLSEHRQSRTVTRAAFLFVKSLECIIVYQIMNRLASILSAQQVLVHVDATSKKRAFEEAGLLFENLHGLSRSLVTEIGRAHV